MTNPFVGVEPRLPRPEGLNAQFYEHASSGVLHIQRCADCGHFQHPPRHLCRTCSSADLSWAPVDGLGTLYSWTTTHFAFDRGWSPGLPYSTGVVELPGAVRLVAALSSDVTPRLGEPVRVVVLPQAQSTALLYLVPSGPTSSEGDPWS
jgi:uncharacterized OB-fold protein